MNNKHLIFLMSSVAVLAAVARLMQHAPNFAAIMALSIVAGYYVRDRRSWALPLLALLISDLFLGFYTPGVMVAVYGSTFLAWALARLASRDEQRLWLVPATLASSLVFFLITNAAVWAFTALYPHTLAGLSASYTAAIPFFRNSLVSDVFFTAILVAVCEAALAIAQRHSLVDAA